MMNPTERGRMPHPWEPLEYTLKLLIPEIESEVSWSRRYVRPLSKAEVVGVDLVGVKGRS